MSEEPKKKRKAVPTLCWDCRKATGGCSWSDELKPVKGSKGWLVHKQTYKTVQIVECPEFERDAYKGGMIRIGGDTIYDAVSKDT